MKNLLRFRPFLFCLFGFFLNGSLVASSSHFFGHDGKIVGNADASVSATLSCYTPTWPTTSNITQNAATFSWDAVSGAQNYSVQTRVPNGTWYNVPGSPFTNTTATVTWFLPNTTYEWRVKANCSYGESSAWTYPVTFTTLGWPGCDTPGWLYTTNVTQTTATFDWEPVSGALNYSVQYRLTGGSWTNIPGGTTTQTWYTLTGLQPGTCYEWRVRTNCANWMYSPWSYPEAFCTLGDTCTHPYWLYTSNITTHSAKLNWEEVDDAISYSLQLREVGGYWYDVPGGPFYGTWHTLWDLDPNTCYEWRVRSNCSNWIYSPWSYPEEFCTLGETCTHPYWLNTSNITTHSAKLNWENVDGAISYSIQLREVGGYWYDVPGGPFYGTWHTLWDLEPGTCYEWRVRSNCSNWNYSPWSYPEAFCTLGETCTHPYWLYSTNITHNSAKLNWDHVNEAISYSIQLREVGGYWYDVPGGPFFGTWHTLWDLEPNTCYEWRVRSNCSNWNYSPWSYPEVFCTLGYSCPTPTWPSVWDITHTTATFSWDLVYGAYNYTVQIRLLNGDWWDVPGSPTHSTWITVYELNPCTTYQWRVKANCGYGDYSYWTQPIAFTTLCGYACEPPGWLYTSNITQHSATLGWDPVYGAVGYSVQYRAPGGTWQYLPGGPFTNTWASISGLQPNTTYEWRVKTICYNWMSSDWSYTAWFTTLGHSCIRPSWLTTHDITATSATLKWTEVYGAWSYSVEIREPNGSWTEVLGSPFTDNIAHVDGLAPCTTYQWRVRTNCEYGNYSYWTKPVSFTTTCIPTCHAPHWVYTTYITESSANFDWAPVYNALSYDIQWRLYGDTTWIDLAGGPFTETWHTVTGLLPGTTYEWHVRSNCSNGLTSDWSVTAVFTTLGPSCATPSGTSTNNVTDTSAILGWTAVPFAQSYSVQIRVPNGIWIVVPGSPFTETTATMDDLIPGTTYEWRVRANCTNGDHGDWTNPVSFTTSGAIGSGSDECDTATPLTVDSTCVNHPSSNVGATQSSPAPMGWCPENGYKDVWFTFTMPDIADPVVTIRTTAGTLTDGIMEVYRGSSCSDLQYIFCEDDNTWGNGSAMPVITITGSPNETIWVRVWGYAGTTGTFSICVFNYQSVNFAVPEDDEIILFEGESLLPLQVEETLNKDISTTLHISPNPASDLLQIDMIQTANSKVTGIIMMDISGKPVLRYEYDANDTVHFSDQLNVSALMPGMYLMQIHTTSGVLSEKVMIIEN